MSGFPHTLTLHWRLPYARIMLYPAYTETLVWCIVPPEAAMKLALEIRSAEGGDDAKMLVETMCEIYAARAVRIGGL